ncbi:MAG: hypothetical protein B1H08_05345 [Candidatus Omnitrophica bacterium 4484_171]|nr:MAG: hypothetical protein B1H08_05345 [Candidatus Omnitrophica bacterium 4484_171]
MIGRIRGILVRKLDDRVFIDVGGIWYEIYVPSTVSTKLNDSLEKEIVLVVYDYLHIDKSRALPVMIGFTDELERDFFTTFISVSGIGPKAALRAFDKPVPSIARAIEEADTGFLMGLAGIGKQKARQIIAHLQGKVGRFALIKEEAASKPKQDKEIVEEARKILKRLQYSAKEIDSMIKKVLDTSGDIDNVETLLNEIYRNSR